VADLLEVVEPESEIVTEDDYENWYRFNLQFPPQPPVAPPDEQGILQPVEGMFFDKRSET
jgi:hypothetical protein